MIYTYTSSSINLYSTLDFGSIGSSPSSTIDNEFLYLDLTLTSDLIVDEGTDYIVNPTASTSDYGYVVFTDTAYPFGSLKALSSSNNSTTSVFVSSPAEPLRLRSSAATSKKSVWVGNGTLFEIGGSQLLTAFAWLASSGPLRVSGSAVETASYDYNLSSTTSFNSNNYGSVSSAPSTSSNYGLIPSGSSSTEDYGNIISSDYEYPFGLLSISGKSTEQYKPIFAQFGTGSVKFIGSSATQFIPFVSSTGLYNLIGSSVVVPVRKYNTTGSLNSKGNTSETATYHYNTSSVVPYGEVNYGLITASGSTVNYGSVNIGSSSALDNGYIWNLDYAYPFGTLSISGGSTEEYKPTFGQTGSGIIALTGTSTTEFIPSYPSTGLYAVGGSASVSAVKPYITTGSLNNTGTKIEKLTYHYNTSSIVPYDEVNYGLITASGSTVNYGSVANSSSAELDNGYVFNGDYVYPFGTLSISGGSTEEYKPTFGQTGSGIIALTGTGTTQFIPSYPSTGLYAIDGTASVSAVKPYITTGSVNNTGTKIEKTTYHYNTSSVVPYDEVNYGLITASGTTANYGFISSASVGEVDNGYIWNLDYAYPFGTLSISGGSTEEYEPTFGQIGFGSFNISGSSTSTFLPVWISFGLFDITGSTIANVIKLHSGSGSIKNIGTKVEKTTYHYNTSSVVPYDETDYGFITASGTTANYGSVGNSSSAEIDSGYIWNLDYAYPFGVFNFTGKSEESFGKGLYTASGSIFSFGSSSEVQVDNKVDSTILFTTSGESTTTFIRSFSGSGSFANTGIKIETATYHYNTSSVVPYDETDYGLITASGTIVNYGFVNIGSSSELDNSYIFDYKYGYPFGSIGTFGGHGIEEYKPIFGQKGVGTITITGSSTSIFQPVWITTGLFNISGSSFANFSTNYASIGSIKNIGTKIEKATYNYNTSSVVPYDETDYGFITASGTTVNYGSVNIGSSAEFDSEYIWNLDYAYPFGTFNFTGKSEESFGKGLYTASGSLFAVGGESNSYSRIAVRETQLFRISGISRTAYNAVFTKIGSGSLFTFRSLTESRAINPPATGLFRVSGASKESFAKGLYTGSGSLFTFGSLTESRAINPPATGLFRVSGSAIEKNTESYVGSGSLFAVGGESNSYSRIAVTETQLFRVSGTSKESFAKGLYTGSGSLFTFGSLTESSSAVPPATGLFRVSGSAIEKNTESYVGSGSLFTFRSLTESRSIVSTVTGLFRVSGTSKESFAKGLYTGSGSLFIFNSLTESSSAVPPATGLFRVSGSAVEKNTESYFGSGSLFTFRSLTESRAINLSATGLFRVSGASKESFAKGLYTGSGSLFTFRSLTESRTIVVSSRGFFRVSGSAFESFNKGLYTGSGFVSNKGTKIESNTYNYNTSSVVPYDESDYGFITASGTTVDYGSVTIGSSAELDNGYIWNLNYAYPFGTLSISGGSFDYIKPAFVQKSTILLRISGESQSIFKPVWGGSGLFDIKGSSQVNFSTGYAASGFISNVGEKIERTTYHYNTSSVVPYDESDYGLITASGTTVDYGSVSIDSSAEFDNGHIWNLDYAYPFGSLNIFGAVRYDETRYIPHLTGTGSLFAIGGESNSYGRIAVTETQLFRVSGDAAKNHTKSYIGSGSLFTFGSLTEFRAINPPATGLFKIAGVAGTVSATRSRTYIGTGSLTIQTAFYPEFLYYRATRYYTGLGDLSVNGSGASSKLVITSGGGSTSISGFATENNTESYIGSGTEFITGLSVEKYTRPYIGSGNISTFKGISESTTRVAPSDTKLFRISGSAAENHTESYIASGTEFISGSGIESSSVGYIGSGNLFTFNGSGESISAVPVSEGIYRIIGNASESFSKGTYDGSGNLFTFNSLTESRSYSEVSDTSLFRLSGSASESSVNANDVSGSAFVSGDATVLFSLLHVGSGSQYYTGASTESKTVSTETEIDTIRISGISETRYVSVYTFESFGTEYISGNAVESDSKVYEGQGNLFSANGSAESLVISAQVESSTINISGSAETRKLSVFTAISSGTEFVSGFSTENTTNVFDGSGSLFNVNGSAESASYNVPSDTALFRIFGSAVEVIAYPYIASGSEFISGSITENTSKSYSGSGTLFNTSGASESASFAPSIEKQLFRISGNADTAYNAVFTEIGSGTLFAYTGSTESKTSSVPTETQLFKVSGSATSSYNFTYTHVGSGNQTLSGTGDEASTEFYIGTGSLFALNSSTNSRNIIIPRETQLFKFSGKSKDNFTRISVFDSGKINISGISSTERNEYRPPRIFGTII